MRRDAVLLAEIANAVGRILELTAESSSAEIEAAPDRRDSLPWNFSVLGEAVSQLSAALKADHPAIPWPTRAGYATAFAAWLQVGGLRVAGRHRPERLAALLGRRAVSAQVAR